MSAGKVYIVILNYNGWRDTLECLESVLKLDYPNFRIVVVDNHSTDGSFERIQAWARGELPAEVQNPALALMSMPSCPKPVQVHLASADDIAPDVHARQEDKAILLVKSPDNRGYAAGNNLGIRLALQDRECSYLWLLNNDTVVQPDALSRLVQRLQEEPAAGICGSTLVHYHNPSTVQARGGAKFNRWTATSVHVGESSPFPLPANAPVTEPLDYVIGASMFVSRAFVEHVGLMYEDYFLYFEEIDWSWRKGDFRVAYAPHSVVYHKEGASTGMNKKAVQYGKGGDFYLHRNRLLFARRNDPVALPTVVLRLLLVFLNSVQAGRWSRARMFLTADFWLGSGKI